MAVVTIEPLLYGHGPNHYQQTCFSLFLCNMRTSVMQTLGSFSLVSIFRRFDCTKLYLMPTSVMQTLGSFSLLSLCGRFDCTKLHTMPTSVMRTLGSFSLVSVFRRFDCTKLHTIPTSIMQTLGSFSLVSVFRRFGCTKPYTMPITREFIRHQRSENSLATTQNWPAKFCLFPERALLFHNNSPLALHYSPAARILKENPGEVSNRKDFVEGL